MTTTVIADVDINIYKPVEKALLTESNLIILQKLLYSPHDYCKIFKVAICGSDFGVQHIKDHYNDYEGAFINDSYGYVRDSSEWCSDTDDFLNCYNGEGDLFVLKTKDYTVSLANYVVDQLIVVGWTDITFANLLFFLVGPTLPSDCHNSIPTEQITLAIDSLPYNPTESDLLDTLSLLLTWVSVY